MKKLTGILCLMLTLGLVSIAVAQDSPRQDQGSAASKEKSAGSNIDSQSQGQKGDQAERSNQPAKESQGPSGVAGPQGQPGPQGPAGPSGGTTVLFGLDPTIALLVGLGILAVVIVAIVASSRGGHEAR